MSGWLGKLLGAVAGTGRSLCLQQLGAELNLEFSWAQGVGAFVFVHKARRYLLVFEEMDGGWLQATCESRLVLYAIPEAMLNLLAEENERSGCADWDVLAEGGGSVIYRRTGVRFADLNAQQLQLMIQDIVVPVTTLDETLAQHDVTARWR